MDWRIKKLFLIILSVLFFGGILQAADLDDLYKTLVKKDGFFYENKLSYFRLQEKGNHGDASYDEFDATPSFYTFENLFKLSPADYLEVTLGFSPIFPTHYKRSTFTTSGSLGVVQRFQIDYFYEYIFGLRRRKEPLELYLDILERKQKESWNSANYPAAPNYFSYIYAHFEDFKIGARYLSNKGKEQEKSNFSKIRHPALGNGQLNIETELAYKSGKLRRSTNYYSSGTYLLNFFHNLKPHFSPSLTLRYGLMRELEIESGLSYVTPYKYIFEYREYRPSLTSLFIVGSYKLHDDFRLPVKIRYRPKNNLEIMLSSDFRFAKQKLEYWRKAADGILTFFPSKKLTFYNSQPTIKISYLYDNNKSIQTDLFSGLTEDLLRKGQFLIEFQYCKDLTHLDKNLANGPLNLVDPYNAFLYPLDYFVIGSEYAAFLTGNTSRFVTNINPQNYYLGQVAFDYGLSDNFNLGFRLGYHSSCSLHHFTLYDIAGRAYKFKPYYFFDLNWDWRITKNSIFCFNSHFVPRYITFLEIENYTKEFSSKNKYLGISLAFKVLF